MWTQSLWTNKEAKTVHTWINTTKCFVSRLIVKAAFEKECNCYVIGELSERTAKQSSSVWWSAICSNVWGREGEGEREREREMDKKWCEADYILSASSVVQLCKCVYKSYILDEWSRVYIKCELINFRHGCVGAHYVWINGMMSLMQWLCNPWNIGYILIPLQRKSLKEISVFDQMVRQEKSGQDCESSEGTLAGNMMEITQLLFFLKNPKPLKIANSLCRVNPQNSPRARLFKWSLIPPGTAPPSTSLLLPNCKGFTVCLFFN